MEIKNIESFLGKIWRYMTLPSKIVFLLWTIFCFFCMNKISIFQKIYIWIIISIVFFFFLFAQYIYESNKRKKIEKKQLYYYKKNFCNLDYAQKGFYNTDLKLILDRIKLDSIVVNTTVNPREFFKKYENIVEDLRVLSEHEFTGYFSDPLPSQNLKKILLNRPISEIAFIDRAFSSNVCIRNHISNTHKKYLFKHFSNEAVTYFKTGVKYTIPQWHEYTQKNVLSFDSMQGIEFEFFCSEVLKSNEFKNIEVTKGSQDQGVDIIACKDGVKYGIQCKCYAQDIGNKAVQEAFSGAKFYDCHVPVVLTNRHFTPSAKELAQKTGVLLWDREKLKELIRNYQN